MAYGSTAGVQALLPAIGALGSSSVPTSAQVGAWLEQGSSAIDRALSSAGYSVPVLATATVYGELEALADLYAAAYAMMARGLDTVSGQDENRSQTWLAMFREQLAAIAAAKLPDVTWTAPTAATAARVRFTQLKRVDGYSAPHDDDTEMDA
jgi:hypothetical protein